MNRSSMNSLHRLQQNKELEFKQQELKVLIKSLRTKNLI